MPRKDPPNLILQLYTRTPAPVRDYIGLTIARNEIVLNIWNVTYGPHIYPKRKKCSLKDFEDDKYLQSEIARLFGEHVFNYVTSVSKQEKRIENLPSRIFLKILNYMAARDIVHLSQTSRIFFDLCNTEKIWKLLFTKYFKKQPNADFLDNGSRFGWKKTLLENIRNSNVRSTTRKSINTNKGGNRGGGDSASKTSFINKNVKKEIYKINNLDRGFNIATKPDAVKNSSNKQKINNLEKELQAKLNIDSARSSPALSANVKKPIGGNLEKGLRVKPKIDSTKSTSVLCKDVPIKSAIQTRSSANLNNYIKNNLTLQKPNVESKTSNLKTVVSNSSIKIEVPLELQNSAACRVNRPTKNKSMLSVIPETNKKVTLKGSAPPSRRNSAVLKK